MLVGHLAAGLVSKRVEPRLSLGTCVLAAMVADFLSCIFMLSGIEHVQFRSGAGAANYLVMSNIAWSHGLLLDFLWAALFALAYFTWRRDRRGAWVVFAAVLSHWLLDFVSHRPDLPLAPGIPTRLGMGLWTSIPATLVVEGGFWLFALLLYFCTTRPRNRIGIYVFWVGAGLLTLAWFNNIVGPPPPNPHTAPIVSLVFFSVLVAWAFWINRLLPTSAAPLASFFCSLRSHGFWGLAVGEDEMSENREPGTEN